MPDNQPPKPRKAASRGRRGTVTRAPPSADDSFPIVAIGASAGGLNACRKFLELLPPDNKMAFILVQHLDPTHSSMMVDLLSGYTPIAVVQAADGLLVQRNHFYIIPPGVYLSVVHQTLHLTQPKERHGARLPFDFLLHSLAIDQGARTICVVLSGTGADGSFGLQAVKDKGGFVIVQDPEDAEYAGMPESAIATGRVDLVLAAEAIPKALARRAASGPGTPDPGDGRLPDESHLWLPQVIDLLRTRTAHDFTYYKTGTLQRRIERRMAMAGSGTLNPSQYIDILHGDPAELALLAKDLLINVTSFFRDPRVFDMLAAKIIPGLVRRNAPDKPMRIWIAGCSTGEEAYTVAMLFREAISAANVSIKLQIFASDVDADAIETAREGVYPITIEADVPPERIARFFAKEDNTYRISPELRASVVFTVQDVLADPPFSRLDFISCRNLMIYLRPEAQVTMAALFHFALGEGGILLLGTSETIGTDDDRFEVISKSNRLYRHIGRSRPGEFGFIRAGGDGARMPGRLTQLTPPSRQTVLAELCRRLVMEAFAPAAVLIDRKHECLYSMGPTDRFLRIVPGHPSNDLLAMARQAVRTKLRAAIQQASQQNTRVVVPGGRISGDEPTTFSIAVQPYRGEGEELFLVCFVDDAKPHPGRGKTGRVRNLPQLAGLERELESTRTELQGAIYNLEISGEEQKAIIEEALSVQEEYQSTNEELLTSKEELQSLNEELTALNSQLQETLERQRVTANDLQNVLYSTDVATLFLDRDLNIRFFTPATKALFSILPGDIGRPLSDLNTLAADLNLLTDAKTVLRTLEPAEREIEAGSGAWYVRRVLPYRTRDNSVEGIVVTFSNVTERRRVTEELAAARLQADLANTAKSRFLAAASHDLRQPLQTLVLMQGLLAKNVESEKAKKLVGRLDETLGAMSGMLNTLLDINQIESGTIKAEPVNFPVDDLLKALYEEFHYVAQAKGVDLRRVRCGLSIASDPRLLEQMIRNVLSNALKYTKHGKILLGCRRCRGRLNIEVWDTGIGIPDTELHTIFEEYRQLGNPARERSRGLGLGLSIVHRLSGLLAHPVRVRSQPGRGSVFTIEVGLASEECDNPSAPGSRAPADTPARQIGKILVIEDDPDVRELLAIFLKDEGHDVTVAYDGVNARDLVAGGMVRPDLIVADYNLPNGLTGAAAISALRVQLQRPVPGIILTGDISAETASAIALHGFVQLNKPMNLPVLTQAIQGLLPGPRATGLVYPPVPAKAATIFVVDDDDSIRGAIRAVLEDDGRTVEDFDTCEAFLAAFQPGREACLIVDAYLPGMDGIALLRRLADAGHHLPAIMITGNSDVAIAVQAMKAGASDFIEKPVSRTELLACVDRAIERSRDAGKLTAWRQQAAWQIAGLTSRQREIMDMVVAGLPSKTIAADLGISRRTVENHRAAVMSKTGIKSLPALARLVLAAKANETGDPDR